MRDLLFVYLTIIGPILFYSGSASSGFILSVMGILIILTWIEGRIEDKAKTKEGE